MKYVCDLCGWEYDEEKGYTEGGIAPDTAWEDVPDVSNAPCVWSARISSLRHKQDFPLSAQNCNNI